MSKSDPGNLVFSDPERQRIFEEGLQRLKAKSGQPITPSPKPPIGRAVMFLVAVAVGVIALLWVFFKAGDLPSGPTPPQRPTPPPTPGSCVVVTEQPHFSGSDIAGAVANRCEYPLSAVSVSVGVYDRSGQFLLGSISASASGLRPGETWLFSTSALGAEPEIPKIVELAELRAQLAGREAGAREIAAMLARERRIKLQSVTAF